MPGPVVERLESLSNYEPVFAAGSESAARNPIAWAHWRIPVGTRTRSVLSRVAFVQLDFSGRPGKFAHHLVLDPKEQSPAGPGSMMMQPEVMKEAWASQPMVLPARRIALAAGDAPTGTLTCDWTAQLADAFRQDPEKPAYIVYQPGLQLLPLLNQAISLLPIALRWQVTFNTYFAELPAGLSCTWRCVVANTSAAAAARNAQGSVIDLTHDSGGN